MNYRRHELPIRLSKYNSSHWLYKCAIWPQDGIYMGDGVFDHHVMKQVGYSIVNKVNIK